MQRFFSWMAVMVLFLTMSVLAQTTIQYNSLDEELPFNPKVTKGKLENGLIYYVMENKKPEKRLELRLAIKAGSILEENDQKGLAHFVEHMCFNGTKNFPKNDLVGYLESIGMRFGPDLNAYTSFDETVYMLQLPTDNAEALKKGFQVLEDWAHQVSLEDAEIDKERGVILEEWRLGRGAQERVMNKHYPNIFYNSRYAERLPIGDKDVILNHKYEVLRRFYQDWYRPDLMAVVAIGDMDKTAVEQMIKEYFGRLKPTDNPRTRTEYLVPNHDKVLVSVAQDKELPMPFVYIMFLHDDRKENTYGGYRQNIVDSLFNAMLNSRLRELTRQANPPFLQAFGRESRFLGNKRTFSLFAAVKADGIYPGTETLLTEAFRVFKHGFTASELERKKNEALRSMKKIYNERDKTESKGYADEYTRHFLEAEACPGIEYEFELYKKFIPEITLEDVNKLAQSVIKKQNVCILISAPDKAGIEIPDQAKVLALFDAVSGKDTTTYKDAVLDKPLFDREVTPGKIESKKEYPELGITELKLSNGARVILKPTDFKNDEVLFRAFSFGGTSQAPDHAYISADNADDIVGEAGLGNFDVTTLEKMLSGKIVRVAPFFTELTEELSGSASPEDLETMFQLAHLYFTSPRKNQDSFTSYVTKAKEQARNNQNSPERVFYDTARQVISNYHFRTRPITEAVLGELDLQKAMDFYQDRFADASDFTFFLIGNFRPEAVEPMLNKYLASLPALNRTESWKDVGKTFPQGTVAKEVKKGIEPKSTVILYLAGKMDLNFDTSFEMQTLLELANIRLREVVREDKSGVYGIHASAYKSAYPKPEYRISIAFGCAPDRVEELIGSVNGVIKELQEKLPEDAYVTKVKEILKRQFEVNKKQNRYWLAQLYDSYYHGRQEQLTTEYKNYESRIEKLSASALNETAKKYLNTENFVRMVLNPEK